MKNSKIKDANGKNIHSKDFTKWIATHEPHTSNVAQHLVWQTDSAREEFARLLKEPIVAGCKAFVAQGEVFDRQAMYKTLGKSWKARRTKAIRLAKKAQQKTESAAQFIYEVLLMCEERTMSHWVTPNDLKHLRFYMMRLTHLSEDIWAFLSVPPKDESDFYGKVALLSAELDAIFLALDAFTDAQGDRYWSKKRVVQDQINKH